jgi:hypothetical protein
MVVIVPIQISTQHGGWAGFISHCRHCLYKATVHVVTRHHLGGVPDRVSATKQESRELQVETCKNRVGHCDPRENATWK